MDYVNDVTETCDLIEEKIYELNSLLRDNEEHDELIIEMDDILSTIKKIKSNVNEENAYNARNELLSIKKEVDSLLDNASK